MMTSNPTPHRRYWSLSLLFLGATLNLFDRQIMNVLAQDIKTDLHISDTALGLLTGTAFGIFYSVLGIPLGRLADRVDRVRLIAAVIALWSCFTAMCGLAGSFMQLFVMRMGVGIGEAGSQPASTALIPDLFSEQRRNTMMALFLIGAPAGGFLGLLFGGYLGSTWGWRKAFVVAGIPGVMLAALMFITMRDPRSSAIAPAQSKRPQASLPATLEALARGPRFKWLMMAMIFSTFLVYASGAWFPAFFKRMHGMTTADIGRFAALSVGLGGGLGTIGGGLLSDWLRSRVRRVESKVLMVTLALSIPALLGTVFSPDRSIALGSMLLFNVCAYGWLGPMVTLIQNEVGTSDRALALAVCTSIAGVVSLAGGLPLVGAISDALTPSEGPAAIAIALAITVVAAALAGIAAHWRALRVTEMAGGHLADRTFLRP
jgi:predicted MFS family arabinose efflux permease